MLQFTSQSTRRSWQSFSGYLKTFCPRFIVVVGEAHRVKLASEIFSGCARVKSLLPFLGPISNPPILFYGDFVSNFCRNWECLIEIQTLSDDQQTSAVAQGAVVVCASPCIWQISFGKCGCRRSWKCAFFSTHMDRMCSSGAGGDAFMESSEFFQVEICEWVLCPDAQDFGADHEDRDCHLRNTARDHHYLERCMFPPPIWN